MPLTEEQNTAPAFDPFIALTEHRSVATLHNVCLIDVQPGAGGFDRLTVEYNGVRRELNGGGKWSPEYSKRDIERFGHLVPARRETGDPFPLPDGAVYFRPYIEPSLRRVPELDDANGNLGWRCDGPRSRGFTAPAHIIPGKSGNFVPDKSVSVTVRVPPEFIRECRRVQLTPQELLEGFIGDAAGIHNFQNCPRADGFGSNGSDERDMAEAWIYRAYGVQAVDLDELEAKEDEEQQRELAREDFGGFLDQYIDAGGTEDALFKAVETLIDQKLKEQLEQNTQGPQS